MVLGAKVGPDGEYTISQNMSLFVVTSTVHR